MWVPNCWNTTRSGWEWEYIFKSLHGRMWEHQCAFELFWLRLRYEWTPGKCRHRFKPSLGIDFYCAPRIHEKLDFKYLPHMSRLHSTECSYLLRTEFILPWDRWRSLCFSSPFSCAGKHESGNFWTHASRNEDYWLRAWAVFRWLCNR